MDISPEQLTVIALTLGATATVITAIIGAVVAIKNNNASRKSEYKLSILRILLDAAYKEYEFRTKEDLSKIDKTKDLSKIKSFTEYIIFYKELANLFSRESICEADLVNSLKNNKKMIDTYYNNREKERPEHHKG